MKLKLHQADVVPDWTKIPLRQHNRWQRIARNTHGVATPGNAISFTGFSLVLIGLWMVMAGGLWQGTVLVSLGRIADVLDGIAADRTGTKSPLGEVLDTGFDKVSNLAALAVFAAQGVLPMWLASVIAVQNVVNILVSFVARWYHVALHPSRSGKLSATGYWSAIVAFVMVRFLWEHHTYQWQTIILVTAYGLAGIGLALGIRASLGYIITTIRFSSIHS